MRHFSWLFVMAFAGLIAACGEQNSYIYSSPAYTPGYTPGSSSASRYDRSYNGSHPGPEGRFFI